MTDCVTQLHKNKAPALKSVARRHRAETTTTDDKWPWKTSLGFMVAVSAAAWLGFFVVMAA